MSENGPTLARRPFASLMLIALLGIALITALALSVLPRSIHHAMERCAENGGCMALVREGRLWIGPLLLALVPWSLFHGLHNIIGQWRATHRTLARLGTAGDRPPVGQLPDACRELGLSARVDLVDYAAPLALCRGYLCPRIVLSSGAIALLSPAELVAVLRHELAHLRRRHPLQLLVARALAASLPFVPVLRELAAALPQAQELAADRAVIEAGQRRALGQALIVMLSTNGDRAAGAPLAVGMSGALDARMDQLIGAARTTPRLSRRALIGSALFFAVGVALLLLETMGLPGQPPGPNFSTEAAWPASYLWHALLLPTLTAALLLEGIRRAPARRNRCAD